MVSSDAARMAVSTLSKLDGITISPFALPDVFVDEFYLQNAIVVLLYLSNRPHVLDIQ